MFRRNVYVIDALYGKWEPDSFIFKLIRTPEVQRLRDIRLSNINSLFLPGSANISRFEHSLGVAYLAREVGRRLRFSLTEKLNLMVAGLLHDIGTPPFGHTVEFLLRRFGFDHEETSLDLIKGEFHEKGREIKQFSFCGRMPEVYRTLKKHGHVDVEEVASMVRGGGQFGKLIKGTMDLDNIDGVYRMIFHTGLSKTAQMLALKIVRNFKRRGNEIYFNKEGIKYIKRWNRDRGKLYSELLRNQADCQAKAMLSVATEFALKDGALDEYCWKLTESEFVVKLLRHPTAGRIMKDFLAGRLFNIVGGFLIDDENAKRTLPLIQNNRQKLQRDLQEELEEKLKRERIIGKKRSFDIIIDLVSAAERRGVTNLPFIAPDLLSEVVRKTVDRSMTRWLLGVYTPRKIDDTYTRRVFFICKESLSTMLGFKLDPAWEIMDLVGENRWA